MTETASQSGSVTVEGLAGALGALTAAVTASKAALEAQTLVLQQGFTGSHALLTAIRTELDGIRHCICNPSDIPETKAMRELAIKHYDLPPAQKWAKLEELITAYNAEMDDA